MSARKEPDPNEPVALVLPRAQAEMLVRLAADLAASGRMWRILVRVVGGVGGAIVIAYYFAGLWNATHGEHPSIHIPGG